MAEQSRLTLSPRDYDAVLFDLDGVLTRSAGLLPPNHYLSVAIHYLFQNRPRWGKDAAFAVLERARDFMEEAGQPFDVALSATRAGNLFTTHTAVAAGFDRFAPALIEQYLGAYAEQKLGITLRELLALGRRNADDPTESFNMAYLAIRGSGAVNGVSRLHGQVSRHLFEPLFPHWPQDEISVGHVTNGVHMPTWDSAPADDLWTEACGKNRWLGTTETEAAAQGQAHRAQAVHRQERPGYARNPRLALGCAARRLALGSCA